MGILGKNEDKKKNRINKETATESFEQFCEDWEIDAPLYGECS